MMALMVGMVAISPANANTIWATDVIWNAGSGVTIGGDRYDPNKALGIPDPATNEEDFLSLGLGGYAIFDFGQIFDNEGVVVETTYNNRDGYPESAKVYVAGSDFTSTFNEYKQDYDEGYQAAPTNLFTEVGDITNQQMESTIDLTGLSGPFRYLMVEDITGANSPSTDGFDIDAVGVAPVPEPGTVILLGVGLVGLAGARRKMKR